MPPHLKNRSRSRIRRFVGLEGGADDLGLYTDLVRHAPVGLIVLNPQKGSTRAFEILVANEAAIEISALKGLDPANVRGKKIGHLFPSICERDLDNSLSRVLLCGCPCHLGQVQLEKDSGH